MAETAQSLITRALRRINVPGRGALIDSLDLDAGMDVLQDLLSSTAASKSVMPGVTRHFFTMPGSQHAFTYGPGGDLDTDDFDDPAPILLEQAYMRAGGTITDNELVTAHEFLTAVGWTVGANWAISNGRATASGAGTLEQNLALVANRTYTVKAWVTIEAGDVQLQVLQDAALLLDQTLDSSGEYSFDITFTGTTSEIQLVTGDAADDLYLDKVSIIQTGLERMTLGEAGSDYWLRKFSQRGYNRGFTKGAGGRPSAWFYNRPYPLGDLRFDNAPIAGEIFVCDVLVDRLRVTNLANTVPVHDQALRYLSYKIADELAGEYGKELTRRQVSNMTEAENLMLAANKRKVTARVDGALLDQGSFNIEAGDP